MTAIEAIAAIVANFGLFLVIGWLAWLDYRERAGK